MGRPPSADPKEVVTLRLRRSTLDAYKAAGDDWRARMETAIETGIAGPTAEPPARPVATAPAPKVRRAAPAPQEAPRSRLTIDDVRPKFTPRLKNR